MNTDFLLPILLLFALTSVILPLLCVAASECLKKKIRYSACYLILILCAVRILIPTGFISHTFFDFSDLSFSDRSEEESYIETSPLPSTDVSVEDTGVSDLPQTSVGSVSDGIEASSRGFLRSTMDFIKANILYIVIAILAAGFVCCMLRVIISQALTSRKENLLKKEASFEVMELYRSICAEKKIKRAPALYMLDSPVTPHLCGVIKPKIYIGSTKLSRHELSYVLEHELMHYKRHDIHVKWFLAFTLSVFWWNPAVWCFVKYTQKVIELSCDERVLGGLDDVSRFEYGNAILKVLKEAKHSRRMLDADVSFGKNGSADRFKEIVNTSRKKKGYVSVAVVLSLFVVSAMLLGCTAVSAKDGPITDRFFIKGECDLSEKQLLEISKTLDVPEKEGMRMIGWNVFSEKTESGDYSIRFEAAFEPRQYQLKLIGNGGYVEEKRETYEYGTDLPEPKRPNYTFGGWYSDIGLTKAIASVPAENTTLYARWLEETPTSEFGFTEKGGSVVLSSYKGDRTEITVPAYIGGKAVSSLAINCFEFNTSLERVVLPATVTQIGVGAFRYCYRLREVAFGGEIKYLDQSVFEACYELQDIFFGGSEVSRNAIISAVPHSVRVSAYGKD